jgi:glutamyl-tRNA reductase
MEVFCSCSDIESATEHIFDMLSDRSKIDKKELQQRADVFDDSSAIHHLFSVASSLDSMVIGETQIAGQLKDAFRFSHDRGFSDKKIARAMRHAFSCAAKVRNHTDISSKPVSIASVAVSQLKELKDDLSGKKALVIGVGEMSEISAKHLLSNGADVYIMNRTKDKAKFLAEECGAKVIDYEQLPHAVNEFEIIFTATSAPKPIITDAIIKECDFERYWFDMALPRDIDFTNSEGISVYQIDDLKTIVSQNIGLREESARAAHGIIGRDVVEFFELLTSQDIEPIIKEIYKKAFVAAEQESLRVISKGFLPKEYESEAKKMCEQTVKRFLHEMTLSMRNSSKKPSEITTHMKNIFTKSVDKEKIVKPEYIKG